MPETRKLAAILAADVAGYSELAGADEERTLAVARRQQAKSWELRAAMSMVRPVAGSGQAG
jgi:adenylate cyclase